MKTTLALLGPALLLAATAFAGPDVIIKQHAKDIRDQNNVRQGVAPPVATVQPARPSATTAAAPTPVQQSLVRLRADLVAIKPNAPVTPEQKQQVARDLQATAQGAKKLSYGTAAGLANELSAALAQKSLSDPALSRLLTDLAAVLNPANIQTAQMQAICSDIRAIFETNSLAHKDAVKIADAAKAIAAETHP
ncbi:MAG: hypothetical protein WCL11_03005 [Verrucomicrobiota bacterium]